MDVQSTSVIVIGGGISGLCAAKLLFEHGIDDVLVLEARDRVGGRTHTIQNSSVQYTDLGGSYVGPTQDRIQRVARELGVKTYRVYLKGKSSEYFNGRRKQYGDGLSTWNPIAILDYYNLIRTVEKMCDSVDLDRPWEARKALEWDRITCQEFFNKKCWTSYCEKRMIQIYQDAFATEPWEASFLYFLWYLKCCDGILRSVNADNGGQERKFVGGSQQISVKIKDKLGDRVILNSPVIRLTQNDDYAIVTCENGKSYKAKYVVSAMPLALLNHISFEPPLLSLKNQLIQRIPMGSVIKTLTFYDKAFWREKGLNGFAIADSESGPVQAVIDDTKPDGSHPALMGFISGDQARQWCNKTQEERKKAVCEQYSKVYGCKEALNPCHYVDKNWLAEKYSGGCYVSVMPPGVLTKYGPALRCPVGRLYFAGSETATFWSGYMDGAVQAGERAAREVLFKMGKVSEHEIHQDEPPPADEVVTPCQLTPLQKCLPTVPGFIIGVAFIAGSIGFLSCKHFTK